MQKNMGKNPYDRVFDIHGILDSVFYGLFFLGGALPMFIGSLFVWFTQSGLSEATYVLDNATTLETGLVTINEAEEAVAILKPYNIAGRCLMGIGGVLLLAAAALKIAQLLAYYNRTFIVTGAQYHTTARGIT